MGRVKELAMAFEESYMSKAEELIGGCESFAEFVSLMKPFRDKMAHYTDQELDEILDEAWYDKWSKYQ